jgi:hypothetical protein
MQARPPRFALYAVSVRRPGTLPGELLFASFLQIPSHDGHPCFWLTLPTTKRVADFHRRVTAHAGRTDKKAAIAAAFGIKQESVDVYYRGQRFIIHYKRDLNDKEVRVHIAHELGHLFLIACLDSKMLDKRAPLLEKTEPLSSIFGIFTVSEKNDFYYNVITSGRAHDNWGAILDDFRTLND